MPSQQNIRKNGFTLIEVLVGVAVFVTVSLASYRAFTSLMDLVRITQYKIAAINLINEQFELVRNLPYADVGVAGSVPTGKLTHEQIITRGDTAFTVLTTVRNIDLAFDGTIGGTPNDLSPADNKLVEVTVSCETCKSFRELTLTTNVAPKNLETASTNGALFIKVFDANGVPVQGADVHVVNSSVVPTITIDDTTNNDGLLQLVDVPPGVGAYNITVTKDGYSTDRTYQSGASGNPNPTKPYATVVLQQVTQVSFTIDAVSNLNFESVTDTCSPVGGFDFNLAGDKLIGVNVPKYSDAKLTNGSGLLSLANMEWDSYTVTGADGAYDLVGINPLNPVFLNPNTTQDVQLIVAAKDPRTLLVTVKDSITELPLTDATVLITKTGFSSSKSTDRGYLSQTDWSGGAGQASFSQTSKYFSDDGNIDTITAIGDITLAKAFGDYVSSGTIESSTFDTGSASNFHQLIWNPSDQATSTGAGSLKFQLATNATSTATTTWTYKGPDGTASTYYAYPYSTIHTSHDGDRFLRYKAFLSTASASSTPNLSDVSFTFTSDCTPPGQVSFSALTNSAYTISVGKVGYATTTTNVTMDANWKEEEILLIPN